MPARKVLLLLDLQHFGRAVTSGILLHAQAQPSWRCHIEGWGERTSWDVAALRSFDGIIALVRTPIQAERLAAAERPVVNVSGFGPGIHLPSVLVDDHAVGRMGAEWLLARGWRRLGFVAGLDRTFVHARLAGFAAAATAAGATVHPLLMESGGGPAPPPGLDAYLAALPRPAAIMGANDYSARQVAFAAREAGIRIPGSLAVLGVDNDDLVCGLTAPPLGSIAIDGPGIGRCAARLLDRLMSGEPPPAEPLRIPPIRVIPRLSIDAIAIDDPDLAAAWACMRARACTGISVDDVVAAVHLSRSVLEKRFHAAFGTTIGAQLRRLRLDEARRLLAETDLPLGRVARACGFSNAKQLGASFVQDTGQTLTAWRRWHQGRIG